MIPWPRIASRPATPFPYTSRFRSVVDRATVYAGPFAATMLGDLGADLLKVELPGVGDSLRSLPPYKNGVPLWWKVTNRNKRGITIDLRRPEGRELLGRLLPRSEEHTSELQSLMSISYAVFCLKKKTKLQHDRSN